jgi:hypothetical protein
MHDKKIKIVHILEGFMGGASTHIRTVLPQLVQKGFDVTLIGSLNRCCPDAHTRISELRDHPTLAVKIQLRHNPHPLFQSRCLRASCGLSDWKEHKTAYPTLLCFHAMQQSI